MQGLEQLHAVATIKHINFRLNNYKMKTKVHRKNIKLVQILVLGVRKEDLHTLACMLGPTFEESGE